MVSMIVRSRCSDCRSTSSLLRKVSWRSRSFPVVSLKTLPRWCEFALPDHADLMLKFASGQRLEPFHQPPQWLRDAAGDCYSEAGGNQQRNESSDWHD